MERITFRTGSKQRRHFTATNHRPHQKSFHHCNKNRGKIAREDGPPTFLLLLGDKAISKEGESTTDGNFDKLVFPLSELSVVTLLNFCRNFRLVRLVIVLSTFVIFVSFLCTFPTAPLVKVSCSETLFASV